MATATPGVDQLAAELGRPAASLGPVLAKLERTRLVESWPDPCRAGSWRVMLSGLALARLGLRLAPRGDRWEKAPGDSWPAKLNPDRRRA